MNDYEYSLLSLLDKKAKREIDTNIIEELKASYFEKSRILKCQNNLSEEDFNLIISTIFNTLKLSLTDEEIKKACENYLTLLLADGVDDLVIDVNWAINHLFYLCVIADKKTKEKIKNYITYLQNKLFKIYKLKETTREKTKRKIYTGFITK